MAGTGSPGPVSVALVGYGAIAEMHAIALQALGACIRVVSGPNLDQAQAFASRHAIEKVTTNADQAMTDPEVEAVVVASPSSLHAAHALTGLDAGRHVLVEIPLALSYPEAEALVTRAAGAGGVLMVCHTLRYSEPFLATCAAIKDRGLQPRNVVARSLSRRHENVGWTGRPRSWTDDLLWHHGGHVVDAVLGLLTAGVTEVFACTGPIWAESGLPMDYAIALRADDGGIATISLSYNARTTASDYVVISEEDTIVLTATDVRSAAGPIFEGHDFGAVHERAVLAQDRDFLASVATGRPPVADAAAILPAMRILQAVRDCVR